MAPSTMALAAALVAAGSSAAGGGARARPIHRHVGRWASSPNLVPGAFQQPDGPLAGGGDFGVVIGGGRNCCGGRCCTSPGVMDADLGFYFGKNDYWVNGPAVINSQGPPKASVPAGNGEWWSHATPGYVLVSIGGGGDDGGTVPPAKQAFAATQELATARLNASTAALGGNATLVSSTFVAAG